MTSRTPKVSVVMAAKNVAPYVEAAIASVLSQTLKSLEIIVVDDGSTDETTSIVAELAKGDPRLRLFEGPGRGPATARNLAVSRAAGEWIAVVDADDLILADRFEAMVTEGEISNADLVTDNLVAFYDDHRPEHPWLTGAAWSAARDIGLDDYLEGSEAAVGQNPLGYLKPMFRRERLADYSLRYDESLTIGEDYDLVARALAAGARFRYIPSAGYRYRRHAASISYRIDSTQLQNMLDGLDRLEAVVPTAHRAALDRKRDIVRTDLRFAQAVTAIKRGNVAALVGALADTATRQRLLTAVHEGLGRRLGKRARAS